MLNDERMTKAAAEIQHRFGFCHSDFVFEMGVSTLDDMI